MHECMNIPWSEADGAMLTTDDFLTIKVSGAKYETMKKTMERFPNTLLGNETSRQVFYVPSKNAYFLDRCITSFEAVLYYYQSGGILIRPPSIPMHVFEEEMRFYGIDEEVLLKLRAEEGFITESTHTDKELSQMSDGLKRSIWMLFEYPDSSFSARVVSFWSIFVICLSITVCCLETLPAFNQEMKCFKSQNKTINSTARTEFCIQRGEAQPWFSFELGCITWFTVEYFARLLSSPCKYRFLTSFLNMFDLLAIAPYLIVLGMNSTDATPLSVLRIVRLVRLFRIFKLSRHSMSLQILGNTLKASVRELGMLVFFLFMGVLAFSSGMYYTEQEEKTFDSIPNAFWYCLVTMTTVGYGEVVPKTGFGKLIGSLCALTGVLTLAFPVPVIVSNFEYFYKKDQLNNKRKHGDKSLHEIKKMRQDAGHKVSFVSAESFS